MAKITSEYLENKFLFTGVLRQWFEHHAGQTKITDRAELEQCLADAPISPESDKLILDYFDENGFFDEHGLRMALLDHEDALFFNLLNEFECKDNLIDMWGELVDEVLHDFLTYIEVIKP